MKKFILFFGFFIVFLSTQTDSQSLGFSQIEREEFYSKCIRESDKKTFYTTLRYSPGSTGSYQVTGAIEYNDGYVDQFIVLNGSYLGDGKVRMLPGIGSSSYGLFNCQFIRKISKN